MRAVRSSSSSLFAALAAGAALAGCAHDAAPLPPLDAGARLDVGTPTDPERLARCAALSREIASLRAEMATIREVMKGHRTADQVGGYLGAILFPPVLIMADQQTARKTALDERQAKVDRRLAEESALRCPSTPMPAS